MVEKIAHRQSFVRSLWAHAKFAVTQPRQFVFYRPFGIIWTLYAVTYTVASGSDTIARNWLHAGAGTITFLATTAVNVPLGVWKDVQFARIYGGPGKATDVPPHTKSGTQPVLSRRGVPRAAAAVFLLRDSLTIFGSFTLAPRVSGMIPDSLVPGPHAKATVAQLTVPMLTQLVATPVHLIGLDMYNRQQRDIALANRIQCTRAHLASSTVVRCIRILPAFGFGIVTNTELRTYLHRRLEG